MTRVAVSIPSETHEAARIVQGRLKAHVKLSLTLVGTRDQVNGLICHGSVVAMTIQVSKEI